MTITKSQTQIEAVLSDTDWQAFQFLAGELAGEAEASWEARLADGDVEACEAVARMVELVQAVNRPSQGFATTSWPTGCPGSSLGLPVVVAGTVVAGSWTGIPDRRNRPGCGAADRGLE